MQTELRSKRRSLPVIYTALVVALPLFSVYASGIAGFTMGDMLLLVFFIIRFADGIRTNSLRISRKTSAILSLVIAIPVITIVSILGQSSIDSYSIIIRIVRRLFYYLSVIIVSSEWFLEAQAEKNIVVLGKIGALYLFLQYLAYYGAHTVLHGYLPFLRVYHENYSQIDYQQLYSNMFRPTSFLLEPAHISRYLIVPLVVVLFGRDRKNKWIWAITISAAILASTSGTGLISVAIVWLLWILDGMFAKGGKRVPAYYLLIYIVVIIAAAIALNNSVVQSSIFRIANTNLFNINTAGGARFRGYVQYFQLDFWHKIVGMGYGSTPDTALVTWFSGASYMLYGTGIIGFLICILMFIRLFIRGRSRVSRVLCIIFAFLFFVDDCFMSHVAVLFLSFICLSENDSLTEEDSYEDSISNGHMVSQHDY